MVAARRLDILSRQPEGSSGRPPKNHLNPLYSPISPSSLPYYDYAISTRLFQIQGRKFYERDESRLHLIYDDSA